MLQFPIWKIALIVAVLFIGALNAFPNFFTDAQLGIEPQRPSVETPETLAIYRQEVQVANNALFFWNFIPNNKVNLGLDLQGGVYLLMQIDPDQVVEGHLEVFLADLRTVLNERPVIIRDPPKVNGTVLPINLRRPDQMSEALKRLERLNPRLEGAIAGQRTFEIDQRGDRRIEISVSTAAREILAKEALRKTIEIVRRRVDPDGVTEVSIQPQGIDRIVLEAPGEPDPVRLKSILSRGGRMTFNLVDDTPSAIAAAQNGMTRPGYRLLSGDGESLLVSNELIITGSNVTSASQGFDEGNRPQINFVLNSIGAQKFGRASQANVGRRFAIVLDDKIISAPVIRSAIMSGQGRITGRFEMREAQEIAAVIEAGELPAKLEFIEERTVGASLGEDSIRAGTMASIIGLALVALFMILAYGLLGGFAVLSLSTNIMLILGALSMMGATLTLPGIAGIILTIGMSVDANVLVFERVREERVSGRSPATAISTGYEKAISTILDANITTFIAAAILYFLGSGPVKGFAVTLGIGILTSVFTAFVVTRWLTVIWLRSTRPQKLPI